MAKTTRYIGTAEACSLLNCNQRHVAWLIRNGFLKGKKLGRDWQLMRKQVEEFERARPGRSLAPVSA